MAAAVTRNGTRWIASAIAGAVVVSVGAAWAITCGARNELHGAHDREQIDADRRRDDGDLDKLHQHDAEPDRIDVEVLDDREDERERHHHHRGRIEKAAEEQVHQRGEKPPVHAIPSTDPLQQLVIRAQRAIRNREQGEFAVRLPGTELASHQLAHQTR